MTSYLSHLRCDRFPTETGPPSLPGQHSQEKATPGRTRCDAVPHCTATPKCHDVIPWAPQGHREGNSGKDSGSQPFLRHCPPMDAAPARMGHTAATTGEVTVFPSADVQMNGSTIVLTASFMAVSTQPAHARQTANDRRQPTRRPHQPPATMPHRTARTNPNPSHRHEATREEQPARSCW